jgi:hypothetical protein
MDVVFLETLAMTPYFRVISLSSNIVRDATPLRCQFQATAISNPRHPLWRWRITD